MMRISTLPPLLALAFLSLAIVVDANKTSRLVLQHTALLHPGNVDAKKEAMHPYTASVYTGLDNISASNTGNHENKRHLNELLNNFQKSREFSRFEQKRRNLKSNMKGGSFDAFQTVPLSQGIGTHYATVWVGTPPQPQTVIVDTGSHHTAFPCKPCNNCGDNYHANQFFDPQSSSTFKPLFCGQCTEELNNKCHANQQCTVSQSYAEGSSWSATLVQDTFTCGYNHPKDLILSNNEYDKDRIESPFTIPFKFACQNHLTGLFINQLADGIMGMSAEENTLAKQLYNQNKIEHNMFSMCFKRDVHHTKDGVTAGIMTLGGFDARLHKSPMVYARVELNNHHGWFTVHVRKIWMRQNGGLSAKAMIEKDENGTPQEPKHFVISNDERILKGMIFDSGSTDTYLPRSIASVFRNKWNELTGLSYANRDMKLSREQVMKLPTVLVQLTPRKQEYDNSSDEDDKVGLAGSKLSPESPRDIIIAIPPTHYMEYSPSKGTYTPRIYLTESSGGTLGANAMMNHDILFDWENERVGIAESSCDYEQLVEGEEVLENEDEGTADTAVEQGVSQDCKLSEKMVELACIETVDVSKCLGEETSSTSLPGVSKNTMIIEQEGTKGGKDCVTRAKEIAKEANLNIEEGKILCEDGACDIVIPCTLSCKEAFQKIGNTNNKPKDVDMKKACPSSSWGVCEHTCEQTRMISERKKDGQCHVNHREKRKCHIDNCGSDPCVVPFLVHAIIFLADVDEHDWNKKDEDIFIESFAKAVNLEKEEGDELFAAGDIKITNIHKWSGEEDEDLFSNDKPKTGLELVLEISIYNENGLGENAQCKESDIYPLSQTALDVHIEIGKGTFMPLVIQTIREQGRESLEDSVFASLVEEGTMSDESTVVTSWTIKTEVSNLLEDALSTVSSYTGKDIKINMNMLIGVAILMIAMFCCCGACFGSFCAKRRYQLEQAKNAIVQRMEEKREEKERGEYAQVDGIEMGNIEAALEDSFEDDP